MAQFIQIYSQFIQNGGAQELLKILWALCTECHPPGCILPRSLQSCSHAILEQYTINEAYITYHK